MMCNFLKAITFLELQGAFHIAICLAKNFMIRIPSLKLKNNREKDEIYIKMAFLNKSEESKISR